MGKSFNDRNFSASKAARYIERSQDRRNKRVEQYVAITARKADKYDTERNAGKLS